jgi:branched-chain amino acid transport system substrate-binding protein
VTRATRWGALAAILAAAAAVAALAGTTGGHAATAAQPIVIGWAFDQKGQMAPFDDPALAAAKIRVAQINAKGGAFGGRKLQIKTCDTQNNDPAKAKACAARLLGAGANIVFTTCDVDFATPVVQEAINRGVLAIAPCIGTDQMGPKRFGAKGKLAFSFGNVAQDEGSAMAEYAHRRGWKTASLATNTLLVYFKNVVQAFDKRFTQLGGKIVDRESYATGANNVQAAVTRLNSKKADVIVTSTAFGELPALVSGLRSLGNETPILNSWAGDGTYWAPKSPKVTNYYCVTYASVFGDDPNKDVRKMIAAMKKAGAQPGTGGFVGGASAIDGVVTAIRRAHGSTQGAALAAQLVKFKKVPAFASRISFSPSLHTVFGRQYRVIRINDNKAKLVGLVTAKVLPKL